jgi:2-hydroxychromene-2-carboxylate isomerase
MSLDVNPLQSDRPLIVYLDFKSPYAYLAWQPTLEMARELDIAVDWRPLVLDIPSYLGSAKLGKSGQVAQQNRSEEQWSGVKYAYFDCRRYANLRQLTVRGTVKIWDTNLAAIGMLWARRQGDEVLERYVGSIYEPFWKRELDVEDPAVIVRVLQQAGAETAGFEEYAQADGVAENTALQIAVFDAGIYGVPSYVVNGQVYFGREHLPRVRWHLLGEQGAAPDIAYPVPAEAKLEPAPQASLDVCIDFNCPHSYLALAPTLALADELECPLRWYARQSSPLRPSAGPGDGSRGSRHRQFRAEYTADDIARYAPCELADIYAGFDCAPAIQGLLWLQQAAPALVQRYVVAVFDQYWQRHLAIDTIAAVQQILLELDVPVEDFPVFVEQQGSAALLQSEQGLRERGVIGTPTYLLEDEPFLGRQHLPLLRARLKNC